MDVKATLNLEKRYCFSISLRHDETEADRKTPPFERLFAAEAEEDLRRWKAEIENACSFRLRKRAQLAEEQLLELRRQLRDAVENHTRDCGSDSIDETMVSLMTSGPERVKARTEEIRRALQARADELTSPSGTDVDREVTDKSASEDSEDSGSGAATAGRVEGRETRRLVRKLRKMSLLPMEELRKQQAFSMQETKDALRNERPLSTSGNHRRKPSLERKTLGDEKEEAGDNDDKRPRSRSIENGDTKAAFVDNVDVRDEEKSPAAEPRKLLDVALARHYVREVEKENLQLTSRILELMLQLKRQKARANSAENKAIRLKRASAMFEEEKRRLEQRIRASMQMRPDSLRSTDTPLTSPLAKQAATTDNSEGTNLLSSLTQRDNLHRAVTVMNKMDGRAENNRDDVAAVDNGQTAAPRGRHTVGPATTRSAFALSQKRKCSRGVVAFHPPQMPLLIRIAAPELRADDQLVDFANNLIRTKLKSWYTLSRLRKLQEEDADERESSASRFHLDIAVDPEGEEYDTSDDEEDIDEEVALRKVEETISTSDIVEEEVDEIETLSPNRRQHKQAEKGEQSLPAGLGVKIYCKMTLGKQTAENQLQVIVDAETGEGSGLHEDRRDVNVDNDLREEEAEDVVETRARRDATDDFFSAAMMRTEQSNEGTTTCLPPPNSPFAVLPVSPRDASYASNRDLATHSMIWTSAADSLTIFIKGKPLKRFLDSVRSEEEKKAKPPSAITLGKVVVDLRRLYQTNAGESVLLTDWGRWLSVEGLPGALVWVQIRSQAVKRSKTVPHSLLYQRSPDLQQLSGKRRSTMADLPSAPVTLRRSTRSREASVEEHSKKSGSEDTLELRGESGAGERHAGVLKPFRVRSRTVEEQAKLSPPVTSASTGPGLIQRIFGKKVDKADRKEKDREKDKESRDSKPSSKTEDDSEAAGESRVGMEGLLQENVFMEETEKDEEGYFVPHFRLPGATLGEDEDKAVSGEVRLWCGTWNLGAKEPFASNGEDGSFEELSKFVDPTADIFVLGVQEAASDRIFTALEKFVNSRRPSYDAIRRMKIRKEHDRVAGHGDGSLLSLKFTARLYFLLSASSWSGVSLKDNIDLIGIAVFVSKRILSAVRLVKAAACSAGAVEGSKGGAAVVMVIFDTVVAFVSSHLSSKSSESRLQHYIFLNRLLGNALGSRYFQLQDQFHHIVWMGDLNYRLALKSATEALRLMSVGKQAVLERLDELSLERMDGGAFLLFDEADKVDNFWPTYKKFEGHPTPDYGDPQWPQTIYRIEYKVPWYKSGRVEQRIPGYCDRILFRSLENRRGDLYPETASYASVEDGGVFAVSDHSPVRLLLRLKVFGPGALPRALQRLGSDVSSPDRDPAPLLGDPPPTVMGGFVVRLFGVLVLGGGVWRLATYLRALFPLPFEGGGGINPARTIRPSGITDGEEWVFWGDVSKVTCGNSLHLLLRIHRKDGRSGQCYVPISSDMLSREQTGCSVQTFTEFLYRDGRPLYGADGARVVVRFSLQVRPIPEESSSTAQLHEDDESLLGHIRRRLSTMSNPPPKYKTLPSKLNA